MRDEKFSTVNLLPSALLLENSSVRTAWASKQAGLKKNFVPECNCCHRISYLDLLKLSFGDIASINVLYDLPQGCQETA